MRPFSIRHTDTFTLITLNYLCIDVNQESTYFALRPNFRSFTVLRYGLLIDDTRSFGCRGSLRLGSILSDTGINLFIKIVEIALTDSSILLYNFIYCLLDGGVEFPLPLHFDVVPVAELIDQEFGELVSSVLLIGLTAGGL